MVRWSLSQTLWNALMVFDKDKNGYIDGMELISVLQEVRDAHASSSLTGS